MYLKNPKKSENQTITVPIGSTVYITKNKNLLKNFGTILTKNDDLWKKYDTKLAINIPSWKCKTLKEVLDSNKIPYNNNGGTLSNDKNLYTYLNVHPNVLFLYKDYCIITDKSNLIYNYKDTEKIYIYKIKDSIYLHIKYKYTTDDDIRIFCKNYDPFEVFKEYSDQNSNNKNLIDLYKNRIIKCSLKGKHGKIIEKLI